MAKSSDIDTYYAVYKANEYSTGDFYDDALSSLSENAILVKNLYKTTFTNFSIQGYSYYQLQINVDISDTLGYPSPEWYQNHASYVSIIDRYYIKFIPRDSYANYLCLLQTGDSYIEEIIQLLHSFALNSELVLFRIADRNITDPKPSWFVPDIKNQELGLCQVVKV